MVLAITLVAPMLPNSEAEAAEKFDGKKLYKEFVKMNNINEDEYIVYGWDIHELKFENAAEFNDYFATNLISYCVDDDRYADHIGHPGWLMNDFFEKWCHKAGGYPPIFGTFCPAVSPAFGNCINYEDKDVWDNYVYSTDVDLSNPKTWIPVHLDFVFDYDEDGQLIGAHEEYLPHPYNPEYKWYKELAPINIFTVSLNNGGCGLSIDNQDFVDVGAKAYCYDPDYEGVIQLWCVPDGWDLGDTPYLMDPSGGNWEHSKWFWPKDGANLCTITIGHPDESEKPPLYATCQEEFMGKFVTPVHASARKGYYYEDNINIEVSDSYEYGCYEVTYDIYVEPPNSILFDVEKLESKEYKGNLFRDLLNGGTYKVGEGIALGTCYEQVTPNEEELRQFFIGDGNKGEWDMSASYFKPKQVYDKNYEITKTKQKFINIPWYGRKKDIFDVEYGFPLVKYIQNDSTIDSDSLRLCLSQVGAWVDKKRIKKYEKDWKASPYIIPRSGRTWTGYEYEDGRYPYNFYFVVTGIKLINEGDTTVTLPQADLSKVKWANEMNRRHVVVEPANMKLGKSLLQKKTRKDPYSYNTITIYAYNFEQLGIWTGCEKSKLTENIYRFRTFADNYDDGNGGVFGVTEQMMEKPEKYWNILHEKAEKITKKLKENGYTWLDKKGNGQLVPIAK